HEIGDGDFADRERVRAERRRDAVLVVLVAIVDGRARREAVELEPRARAWAAVRIDGVAEQVERQLTDDAERRVEQRRRVRREDELLIRRQLTCAQRELADRLLDPGLEQPHVQWRA